MTNQAQAELALGATLPARRFGPVDAAWVLRYVEAAQDPNPLHRDPDAARVAGFPGPILPGMLLLGLCERAVETWRGNRTILHLAGRFLAPLAAPAEVEITARVAAVEATRTILRISVKGGPGYAALACIGEAWLSPPAGG